MPNWQAISRSRHANAGWLPYTDYLFAAKDVTSPLLAEELPQAAACYPIAFTQAGEDYQVVVLQSLQPGFNLYVNSQGKWLAPYVPAWYRSHPLRLLQDANGEHLLCVDEDSPLFHAEMQGEQRFFDDEGNISPVLQKVIEFLRRCRNSRRLTQKRVNELANTGLIKPWPLQLDYGNASATPVTGVFQIDEAALQSLPGERLAALAQSAALAMAYTQLLSSTRLTDFKRRYQHRAQEQAKAANAEINLDDLFAGQGDHFKFGF
jgi:hypothetical protein